MQEAILAGDRCGHVAARVPVAVAAHHDAGRCFGTVVEGGGCAAGKELRTFQRAGVDHAAGREDARHTATPQIRRAAVGGEGRIRDHVAVLCIPLPLVDRDDAVALEIVDTGRQMPAAVQQFRAERHPRLARGIVTAAGLPAGEITLQALELVVEHEVHHASDGIGTIGGGGATGHDVDTFDQQVGQRVDVNALTDRGGDDPAAVEQRENARLTSPRRFRNAPVGPCGVRNVPGRVELRNSAPAPARQRATSARRSATAPGRSWSPASARSRR